MKKHAILSTDLSKTSDKLIECAKAYKKLGIEKITLLHVLGLKHVQAFEDLMRKEVDEKMDKQKELLEQKGFEVATKVGPHEAPVELEKLFNETDASLVIVGTHGYSLTKAVMGGTASEIIQNMKYPVLLIVMKRIETREGEDCEIICANVIDHILFPTDFSDTAEEAFQFIKNLNVEFPKFTLMHIQDEIKISKHLENKLEEFNRIDTERLIRLKSSLQKKHPETAVDFKIDYGKPIQKILNFIKENEVTLTVMGSQGRGIIPEIFLGSVSHQVARHADSNVLLVPPPEM